MEVKTSGSIVKQGMILWCNRVCIIDIQELDHEEEEASQEQEGILIPTRFPIVEVWTGNFDNTLKVEAKE